MTSQYWHENINLEDVKIGELAFQDASKYALITSATYNDFTRMVESNWSYTDVSDLTSLKKYTCVSTTQEPFQNSRCVSDFFLGFCNLCNIALLLNREYKECALLRALLSKFLFYYESVACLHSYILVRQI